MNDKRGVTQCQAPAPSRGLVPRPQGKPMKDIIWLSPSLTAGAIAARLMVFFERRPQIRSRRGVELVALDARPGLTTRGV
jgi:hypothetical protein